MGTATATTGITVDGTITGKNINIAASSTAVSSYTDTTAGTLALIAQTLVASFLGLNGGYVGAHSTATVSINGAASITGTGNVSISATGKQDAEDPAISVGVFALGGLGSPVAAGVVVGQTSATVTTNVASGATISAGGKVAISATNDVHADISAVGISATAQLAANVAYLKSDVATSATVESGAVISSGAANGADKGVSLVAANTNYFSASANSFSLSNNGGLGAAVSVSEINTSATATFGASLGTSTVSAKGGLQVEATSVTTKNANSASTSFGRPGLGNVIVDKNPGGAGTFATSTFLNSKLGRTFPLTVAAAVAYATSHQAANASIAAYSANPTPPTPPAAPSIYVDGDVAVVSHLEDRDVHSNASSSASVKDATKPGIAISAGVAYGDYSHNSNALIGTGVTISAADIGVAATTSLPISNSWLARDSFGTVLSHINTNAGAVNDILTSYANAAADASGDSDSIGIAGAVATFLVNNNTTAWVSNGASLTTTGSGKMGDTTLNVTDTTQGWTGSFNVLASATTSTVDISGNAGLAGILNGTGSGGSAAGGAVNYVSTVSTTIAGIADGVAVNVHSGGSLYVDADTSNFLFQLAPTSGIAKGTLNLNGITSIGFINDTTHASIGNTAQISAPVVSVNATETVSQFSTSGALSLGGGSGFGLSVSYLSATADTNAYVGDNSNDRPDGASAGTATLAGHIYADQLTVVASTVGRLTAASVAAVESDSLGGSSFIEKLKAVSDLGSDPSGIIKDATDAISKAAGTSSSGFSIDVAGSSSISIVSLDTNAHIAGATIDRFTGTSTTANTVVQAMNDTLIDVGSGSAAFNLSTNSSPASGAIAGAISVLVSGNSVKAYIDGSTISNEKLVTVQSLSGGRETAVGIGLAVSAQSNAASLSGSIGVISDSSTAYISNSTITGLSSVSGRQIDVDAYLTTDIGIGGGSLYFAGGKGGLGVALTYAQIGNPTGHDAVDSHINQTSISAYDTLNVIANDSSRIAAGAAAGGGGPDANGLAGAIVVNAVSTTVTAYIGGNVGGTAAISVAGAVTVSVDSLHNASFDSNIAALFGANAPSDNSGVDFSGGAIGANQTDGGAAIFAVAGLVQIGKNNVGLSLIYNSISTTHAVSISDVSLSAASVSATANDTSNILGITVGFGLAAGQFAGLASTTISAISNTITAQIGDATAGASTSVTTSTGNIFVKASDSSNIRGAAGTVGISLGQAAVGLSVVDANIGNRISATVDHATLSAGNDVIVQASSTATILTVALGIAISSNLSLAGSISTNTESTNVIAAVFAGDITAHNNVGIVAFNADTISVVAGAAAVVLAPGNAAGLSFVTNVIGGDTKALIGTGSKVDALALGGGRITVDSGDLNVPLDPSSANTATLDLPDLTESTRDVHGLAVVATSRQTIIANAVTAGLAFSLLANAVAVTPIVNVTGGRTEASITGSLIDTRGAGSGSQEIDVTGSSHTYSANFIISMALGGFGGAAAASTNVLSRTTIASISGTTIGTSSKVGDITVKTNSTQAAADVVIGAAVGIDSDAVSAIVNKFNADTESFVVGGVINAHKLDVTAKSINGFFAEAGVGAAAGLVGAAAAFVIAVTSNKTAAYVGDSSAGAVTTLNLGDEITVSADSENRFKSLAVGGALAGGNGYAGMVNVIVATNETDANIYYVNLSQPGSGSAGVTVSALENITVAPTTGAGGLAIFGVGVGAAADIVVLGSTVTAAITEGSLNTITSPGAIAVSATSNKSVDAQTVTLGGGLSAGVGAAVAVVLVGTSAPADASGQINANGTGTLAQADIQTANQTITLSSNGISAYRTALGSAGVSQTDAQIQAAAQAEYSSLTQHGNLGTNTFTFSSDGLTLFAPKALNSSELISYNQLVGESSVTNGVLTLTTAGLASYRTQAGLSSSLTDTQVQQAANTAYQVLVNQIGAYGYTRYQALAADAVTFHISGAGISNYRTQATAGLALTCAGGATTCATDTQVTQYANDQFQKLTSASNGTVSNGVVTLNPTGLSAFRAAAQADANAKATAQANSSGVAAPNPPATVTDAQVQSYANAQYQFLIGHEDDAIGATPFSVSAGISKVNDGVAASIAGGTITANTVSTTATANNSTNNYATGVGAGTFGVGAAVAYTRVDDTVSSTISQSTIHAATVTINASAGDGSTPAVKVEAHAGAGGLTALGAAIADGVINNSVTAALGGTTTLSGAATVSADDSSSVRSDAFGATVGGGAAIGISSATATRASTVSSSLLSSSNVTASALTVQATGEGSSYAGAIAGVGGLTVAGAAAASTATDSSSVTARIGSGETINVGNGTINVLATDTPDAKAFTVGVSVAGGFAVGLSIATATVNPTVLAQLDGSTAPTDIITAGTLNVTAQETVAGTLGTSIAASGSGTPNSTSNFNAGTTNAAAWSIAGSGSNYYALAGASAQANNNSGITANIGNYVNLPVGNVVISATSTTDQVAAATGISVGGTLALGVVVSNANTSILTAATVGDHVTMLANGDKVFKVAATGTDYNTANSVSGGGGLFAGSGAQANTSDNSDVNVRLGNNVIAQVDSIVLSATHDDNFKTHVDSLQAAVVGASGSVAINHANSNVSVTLGDNDLLSAAGSLTAHCFTTLCPQAISITATNNFAQGNGDSVDAAAGGGINGAGGTSSTTLNGSATIVTGTGDVLSSGSNPTSSPGTMSLVASSHVNTNDLVTLTTGGAIEAAGVDSTTHANVDNTITIGNSNIITSEGSIGIGTYTVASVINKAYVATYGVAAVGTASATSDVTTNQTVTIKAGSQIIAFSNVNIAAGQEPFGLFGTNISVAPNAEGTVRGLIAVPTAVATDNISNVATLTIEGASGNRLAAFIGSGQNSYLGAYTGAQDRSRTDATGHGYELGFIPVTDGHTNDGGASSSTFNMGGSITAGIYRNMGIIIGCGSDGNTQCGSTDVPKIFVNGQAGVTLADGVSTLVVPSDAAPVGFTYVSALNPTNYINSLFGTNTDAANALIIGLNGATGNQMALFINTQLYASGGSVTVNADTITGTGTISAYGNAAISVVNNANVYLTIAGGALIPDIGGGNIIFTGAAVGSGRLHQVTDQLTTVPALPTITLNNAWASTGGSGISGPSLFVTGAITNLGGSLSISNSYGSFGTSADLSSQQFTVYVPNGAFSVGGNSVDGFFAGGSPIGQWNNVLVLPGRINGGTDFNSVANYLANALFPTAGNTSTLNSDLYSFAGSSAQGNLHVANGQVCFFIGGTNCFGSGSSFTPDGLVLPTMAYSSRTVTSFNLGDAALAGPAPNIYGGQVAIKANVINLNGNITAGQPTNWSLTLPSSAAFANLLAQDLSQYRSAVAQNANANPLYVLVDDKGVISSAAAVAGVAKNVSTDRAISVSYNAATNQLVLGGVIASSGGGYVVLDGQIINTGTQETRDGSVLNNIHLSAGFGQVTLVNSSGVGIVADSITTGNSAAAAAITSTVKIVDRNDFYTDAVTPFGGYRTTTYTYSPRDGVRKYLTVNGANPTDSTPYTTISASSATFNPVAGSRFQWIEEAAIERTVVSVSTTNGCCVTNWVWDTSIHGVNQNSPWSYLNSSFADSTGESDPTALTTTPMGFVIKNVNDTSAFSQVITGGLNNSTFFTQHFYGCGSNNVCNHGFVSNGQKEAHNAASHADEVYAAWTFTVSTAAWLRVTASVKADYPVGINFSGNANAFINIQSNAGVLLNGNVVNPSGTTTIDASQGDIAQSSRVTQFLSGNLNLTASNGQIGSSTQAITATLSQGANVTTQSKSNTNLNFQSDAAINSVSAGSSGTGYSDVNIVATGDITAAAANSGGVSARNITLTSMTGSVGAIAQPLAIAPHPDAPVNGVINNGIVNISANGDIGITATPSAGNDLRVGSLISTSGDILINVSSGSIVNARGQTAAQALSADQVAAVSSALHLTAADGAAAAGAATVAAFEKKVTSDYAGYNALTQNGSYNAATGLFELNAGADVLYQPFATAAGMTVSAYVTAQYRGYAADFVTAFGTNWPSLSLFSGQYQTYQNLLNSGSVSTGGSFVLRNNNLSTYASSALTGPNANAFNTLLTNGAVAGDSLILSNAGITAYAAAALATADAATLTALRATGGSTVQNNMLTLTSTGIASFAASALAGTPDLTAFNSLLSDGTVTNGVLTLSTAGLAAYMAQAGLSSMNSDVVQQIANAQYQSLASKVQTYANNTYQSLASQVQTYANNQYQGLATTIQTYANNQYTADNAAFTFSATSPQAAANLTATLTANSTWTAGQLVSAIDRSALQPAATTVGNGTVNIAGRNVTITTATGSLGSLAPNINIALNSATNASDNITDGTLTQSELAALAVATTPGSVILNGRNSSGQAVSGLAIGSVPNGTTLTSIDVTQLAPLYINVTGNLKVSSHAAAFLQTTTTAPSTATSSASSSANSSLPASGTTLHIDQVTALGAINIQAQQGILAALSSGGAPLHATQIVSASGDLTLATGSGDLGSAANPLTYQAGRLVSASSGGGSVYLDAIGSDIQIGRIFASNAASLITATGSVTGYLPGIAISANSIVLNIAGDIGSSTTAFGIQAGSGFVISQSALPGYRALAVACTQCDTDAQLINYATTQFQQLTLPANGTVSGGVLTLNATGIAAFRAAAQAAAQVVAPAGTTAAPVSELDVRTYANSQYQFLNGHRDSNGLSGTIAGSGYIYSPQLTSPAAPTLLVSQLTAHNNLSVRADGLLELQTGLTATNGTLSVVAGSLTMDANSSITAAGTVNVSSLGSAIIGQISTTYVSTTTPPAVAITVTAAGSIVGNGDNRTNLVADATHGSVFLTAGTGIGSSAAPVTLNAPFVSATALAGDVNLSAVSTVEATLLSAAKGNVVIQGGGNLTLDSIAAGTATGAIGGTVQATAASGFLAIGTSTSGGTQTLQAANDVTFTTLTTNGVTGDAGDVNVTSSNGKIAGGSVAANGSATLIAHTTNSGASLTAANGYIDLQAPGLINWTSLTAGTTISAVTTDGALTLGITHSGGSQTLQAANDVTLTTLTTNGVTGDVNVTSGNGKIAGGSVAANGSATLIAHTTNSGASLTAANGYIDLQAPGLINWTSLTAGTTISAVTTGGALTLGTTQSGGTQTLQANNDITFSSLTATGVTGDVNVTSSLGAITGGSILANRSATLAAATTNEGTTLTATNGALSLTAGGLVDWTALNAGTTISVRSTADGLNIGTATSGGTQTIRGYQDVAFTTLTTNGVAGDIGDVAVTSDTTKIQGTTVNANGSATLTAATTNKGTTLTTATGTATLRAAGLVDWATLNNGTTIDVRSTGGSVTLGTATSGGSQTIRAAQDVNFNRLVTNGITGDVGDVTVMADGGLIQGTTVAANGSATLTAATTNEGATLTATNGSIGLNAGGLIDWTTLNAGTQINVRSTGAGVTLGTATSGGSQTIRGAQDVNFATLTTNGITGDAGNVGATSDNGLIQGTTVAANGSATLTAATTNKATTLTAATGSATLLAGGLIDWTTLNAGTQINVHSTGAGVTLGTATSGGSQTIRGAQDVNFATLTTNGITGDAGNVGATSDNGLIQGTTVAANGSATLTAATTNKATTLTAATGSATLLAGGLIDWTTLNAGTQTNVRSTAAGVNLGTATSGGSQTVRAAQDVNFNRLTTNGVTGDVGDVTVTADAGLIQGTTVAANGSATLTAATTNKGTTLTTATGSATLLAGGLIDWTNINTAKAFTAISAGGAINLGTVVSGGTQTLRAKNDITYTSLTATGVPSDQGDIAVVSSDGTIRGGNVTAHGDASFDGGVSISLGSLSAGSVGLSTPHDITISFLQVYRSISLAADTIKVTAEQLPSNPPVPLHVTVTGYRGGVATLANLVIDPPEVIVDKLMVTDSVISVDSPKLTITDGYVPGSMMLTTPAGDILLDNRSPAPVGGMNLQLYQPGGVFSMKQFGNANYSDTQVVYYDNTISSTITNFGGGAFTGVSFVRNTLQDMKSGEGFDFASVDKSGLAAFYLLGLPGGWRIDAARTPLPVEAIGEGPAVNIDGLPEAKKLHQIRDRKGARNRIRSTSLVHDDGARLDFAAAAR